MRVKIAPAYLGLSASQSRRSKVDQHRQITKNIWMMQNGMRIPIAEMTDYHLCQVIKKMRWWSKRTRDRLKTAMFWQAKEVLRTFELARLNMPDWIHDGDINEGEEELFEDMRTQHELSELSNEAFLLKFIPCWPTLIEEGKSRGLLNSRGYRTNKIPLVE
jgi:hypothetical protein